MENDSVPLLRPPPPLCCQVRQPLGEESVTFVEERVHLAPIFSTIGIKSTLLVMRSAVFVECCSGLTLNSNPTCWLIMNNRVAGPVVPRSKTTYRIFTAKISSMMDFDVLAAQVADPKAVVAPISNRLRVAGPIVQWKTTYVNFTVKKVQPRQQDNAGLKQTRTLEACFANMKEQRMRALSQQNNNNGVRRNGGGPQRQQHWNSGSFFGPFYVIS